MRTMIRVDTERPTHVPQWVHKPASMTSFLRRWNVEFSFPIAMRLTGTSGGNVSDRRYRSLVPVVAGESLVDKLCKQTHGSYLGGSYRQQHRDNVRHLANYQQCVQPHAQAQ